MALVASSISGAAYVMNNAEEKDTGSGFEFTRRKRWPQLLLQELVGSAIFCLKPVPNNRGSIGSEEGSSSQHMGWKILFVSPSVGDMLGEKPTELEGKDFIDCVYPNDHPQLHNIFNMLLAPHLAHHPSNSSSASSTQSGTPLAPLSTSSKSQTTYVRMLTSLPPSRPSSSRGSNQGGQGEQSNDEQRTVLWEIRAHATGVEGADLPGGFGLGGGGTMVPQNGTGENEMRGKAIWLMGRRVGDGVAETEGNGQNLDAFLELKLENEKLREELRELHIDFDEDDFKSARASYSDPQPSARPNYAPSSSGDSDAESTPSSSSSSSPVLAAAPKAPRVGRPPKDKDARERKKAKKSAAAAAPRASNAGEGEGMHVCVTCGRTDSPEWRKGPLGPKTLCNACGLRWAKRNSTAPTRKEKKVAAK